MSKIYKENYLTKMITKQNAEKFEANLNDLREDEDFHYKLHNTTAYISATDETLYIYRDVDDYTVHAVISVFYAHRLAHVTYSPAFAEIWEGLMGEMI